ncbi:acyltransferase [Granulicella sp. 5B5]|uniref:acyltransferase family protein n=1 Tax=Granulicella sp. 5B5 TaxID=1617967 RepID=UPI0015F75BD2|nr:acyltransferase [Granulicella sp. 5B5]
MVTKTPSRRIEFLDVLRGLAALLVLIQHSVESTSPSFAHFTNHNFNLGEIGVVIFFIVSGFIIPVSLEKYNSLPKFWVGRVLRLWPTYTVSLIVMLLLNRFLPMLPPYYEQHPLGFIVGNISMIGEYLGIPFALGTYWTLSLELAFYLVCSVLFFFGFLKKTELWLWVSALLLLFSQIGLGLAIHRTLPSGRLGLIVTAFFGTLLYRLLSEGFPAKRVYAVLPVLFVVFSVGFWLRYKVYASPNNSVDTSNAIVSWVIAYALFMLVFALRARKMPRILIWIGQISYPLYLFHGVTLVILNKIFPSGWPLRLLIVLSAGLLVSDLVHRFIEKPVARFQHRIIPHKPVVV